MKYWEANFYTVPFRETTKHPHTHVPTVSYILSLGSHPTLWCHYVLMSHMHPGNYARHWIWCQKKKFCFWNLRFLSGSKHPIKVSPLRHGTCELSLQDPDFPSGEELLMCPYRLSRKKLRGHRRKPASCEPNLVWKSSALRRHNFSPLHPDQRTLHKTTAQWDNEACGTSTASLWSLQLPPLL